MTDLHQLLTQLRIEVDKQRKDDPDLDLDTAYQDAIVKVFMTAAESLQVTHFEARILDELNRIDEPITGVALSVVLGMDYFALYYHLRNLEDRGLICRPQGMRGGYKVA